MQAVQPRRLRAIDLIRVSDVNGRDKKPEQNFVSPSDQRKICARIHKQYDLDKVGEFEEMNKSAYSRSLKRRPGLLPSIEMIERGEADVIVTAFMDRLFRKQDVKIEALKRMIAANGQFITGDLGKLETRSAAQRLSLTFMVGVAEFQAEQIAEKTAGAKQRAVEELGVAPYPNIPYGYIKDEKTRKPVIDDEAKLVVQEAFKMRIRGASIKQIVRYVRSQGGTYGFRGVQEMLKNRFYLGELRFGKLQNLKNHNAIIDRADFNAVQELRKSKTRALKRTPSDRLLARLGVVRCGHCDRAMIVGSQNLRGKKAGQRYYDYRCPPVSDCENRCSIGAEILERAVLDYVANLQLEGHANVDERIVAAEATLAEAEANFDTATQNFALVRDRSKVQGVLDDLERTCEQAAEQLRRVRVAFGGRRELHGNRPIVELTRDEQRALIRVLVRRVQVWRIGLSPADVAPSRFHIEPL